VQGALQAVQPQQESERGKIVEHRVPGIALKTFAVLAPKPLAAEKALSLSDPDSSRSSES